MKVGFETIGNATIIAYDQVPLLCTDPWTGGGAYFGSWALTHSVPDDQLQAIRSCSFVWFSHGHPDHLNGDCLPQLQGKTILLADHVGERIANGLRQEGFTVQVLPDRQWVQLSERVKVLSVADYNQDSILLLDINGRLLVNLNDASDYGWGLTVRRIVKQYSRVFLLALVGYEGPDMMQYHNSANGQCVVPKSALNPPLGARVTKLMDYYGINTFIPFSSLHRYQRRDSAWANAYAARLEDNYKGFDFERNTLLPAFVSYDCLDDSYRELNPPQNPALVLEPEDFGDNWSDALTQGDMTRIGRYFRAIEHLGTFLDFINFRVGGQDNILGLRKRGFDRGVTFEVPRNSLMTAVDLEIFDDILIGNFARVSLHGDWPQTKLNPDFLPYVAKYADNGLARTQEELDAYFAEYRRRAPMDYLYSHVENHTKQKFIASIPHHTRFYRLAKKTYWIVRRT